MASLWMVAPMQCLDRCDLHPFKRSRTKPGLNDAVTRCRTRAVFRTRLRYDLAPMRQHQHAAVVYDLFLDDGGGDDRFAGAGRRHQDDAAFAFARTIKFGDDVGLIWMQHGRVMRHPVASADA